MAIILDERLSFDVESFMRTPASSTRDRREATSVYIIQSQDYCKIGIANDVDRRLHYFRAGNPHPLKLIRRYQYASRLHALLVEGTAHKVLSSYSIGREWFHIEPSLATNAVSFISHKMRKLVRRWDAEEATRVRTHHQRLQSDPQYRGALEARLAELERQRLDQLTEYEAVEDFRNNLRAQSEPTCSR